MEYLSYISMLASSYFFLHILFWLLCVGSFSYMYCASFFMRKVSLTHPILAALCGVFLLHFHASYFMLVVSLTHPMLAVWCGEFYLQVPCCLYNVGVSLTHPRLASWCGEFLLHVPWRLVAALCWDFLLWYKLLIKNTYKKYLFYFCEKENK